MEQRRLDKGKAPMPDHEVEASNDNVRGGGDVQTTELPRSRDEKPTREDAAMVPLASKKARKKKFQSLNDRVIRDMLRMMDLGAKGFAYGAVGEDDQPVAASSDSLRRYWKEDVQFHQAAVEAVAEFERERSGSSGGCEEERRKHPPLAGELFKLSDMTLGCMLSVLMQKADPPQRKYRLKDGVPPPWWPTGREAWWAELGFTGQLPYRKHGLTKAAKVVVLVSIVKHMAPGFAYITRSIKAARSVRDCLAAGEAALWDAAILRERDRYVRAHPDGPDPTEVVPINIAPTAQRGQKFNAAGKRKQSGTASSEGKKHKGKATDTADGRGGSSSTDPEIRALAMALALQARSLSSSFSLGALPGTLAMTWPPLGTTGSSYAGRVTPPFPNIFGRNDHSARGSDAPRAPLNDNYAAQGSNAPRPPPPAYAGATAGGSSLFSASPGGPAVPGARMKSVVQSAAAPARLVQIGDCIVGTRNFFKALGFSGRSDPGAGSSKGAAAGAAPEGAEAENLHERMLGFTGASQSTAGTATAGQAGDAQRMGSSSAGTAAGVAHEGAEAANVHWRMLGLTGAWRPAAGCADGAQGSRSSSAGAAQGSQAQALKSIADFMMGFGSNEKTN